MDAKELEKAKRTFAKTSKKAYSHKPQERD